MVDVMEYCNRLQECHAPGMFFTTTQHSNFKETYLVMVGSWSLQATNPQQHLIPTTVHNMIFNVLMCFGEKTSSLV